MYMYIQQDPVLRDATASDPLTLEVGFLTLQNVASLAL